MRWASAPREQAKHRTGGCEWALVDIKGASQFSQPGPLPSWGLGLLYWSNALLGTKAWDG